MLGIQPEVAGLERYTAGEDVVAFIPRLRLLPNGKEELNEQNHQEGSETDVAQEALLLQEEPGQLMN
jgi:hypothetical protein